MKSSPLRILYIPVEFSTWHAARSWSYSVQLALEEGFSSIGAEFVTIPSIRGIRSDFPASWLYHAPQLCRDMQFDQVWIELVHNDVDELFLSWVKEIAPVRVGIIGESLDYDSVAYTIYPHLQYRRALVESRLHYMTHALFADEADADIANQDCLVKGLWWPQAVPQRCITIPKQQSEIHKALFGGVSYAWRENWLKHAELDDLLTKVTSGEHETYLPALFDRVQGVTMHRLASAQTPELEHLNSYVGMIRQIRRMCFDHWLTTLQNGEAIVNLPSLFKGYPGRVVEGMAVGRPVVSWEIPDRPKTLKLFTADHEIMLFSTDDHNQLARILLNLRQHPEFASDLAENARNKLYRHHTVEKRIFQIMVWIMTGTEPKYDDCTVEQPNTSLVKYNEAYAAFLNIKEIDELERNKRKMKENVDPVAIFQEASSLLATGNIDSAKDRLQLLDSDPEIKGLLAKLYMLTGNDAMASSLILLAVADRPKNVNFLIDACKLAIRDGATESAVKFLQSAFGAQPNNLQLEALFRLSEGINPTRK